MLFLVGALIVVLTASVALAKDFICEKVTPESCNGTDSAETITGTDQPNTIYGKGGGDTINGRGGADDLYGNNGNDTVHGGEGGTSSDKEQVRGGALSTTVKASSW